MDRCLWGCLGEVHERLLVGVIWMLHGRMLGRVIGRAYDWKNVRQGTIFFFLAA